MKPTKTDQKSIKNALKLWRSIAAALPVEEDSAIMGINDPTEMEHLANHVALLIKDLESKSKLKVPIMLGIRKIQDDIEEIKMLGDCSGAALMKFGSSLDILVEDFALVIYLVERYGVKLIGWAADLRLIDECAEELSWLSFGKYGYPSFLKKVLAEATATSLGPDLVSSQDKSIDLCSCAGMVV